MKLILFLFSFFISLSIHAQNGKLSNSFIENFSDSVLQNFRYGSTGTKSAFKWQSGVISKTEPEIDFEWLVADPSIIYIGTWTGNRGALKRIGRTINLAKGIIYNTIFKVGYKGEPTPLSGAQNQPQTIEAIDHYDASSRFYTYGFDWNSNRLTWWIIDPETGKKIILWDYQGSQRGIPQHPSYYRMNFWHTNEWAVETNLRAIEKPLHPYELEVDWMRYQSK